MLSIAMIIPTYKRFDDLKVCIASILRQERLPQELIIVDDDQLDEVPLQRECEQQGIKVVYYRKDKPGLTASRNKGITLTDCDLIYFLDDDVELLPGYIANIEQVFIEDREQQIGGVGGVIVNEPPLSLTKKLRRILDRCFLVTGSQEGKVLASGFCVNYGATGQLFSETTAVDFLAGGVVAYRKSVFKHCLFDENFKGYGLGEDKDFSYRLSKHCDLVVVPTAQLNHYESAKMRFDKKRMGYEFVISRYRFFRTHVYAHPLNSVAFYYALFGYTLGRSVITLLSFKQQEYQRLGGILSAITYVISGKAKQDLLNEQ
jgi:GT2 family glycosyltransferase